MAKGTKRKKEPRMIPGTSDYVVRENAARKQLGVAGLAARNKQLPTAAYKLLLDPFGPPPKEVKIPRLKRPYLSFDASGKKKSGGR